MRFIAYLTEPATYTIDLVKNVHEQINIEYKYLQRETLVKTDASEYDFDSQIYLNRYSLIKRFSSLLTDYKSYDAIIFNGYNRLDFILLFVIHIFSCRKTPIALESDTQLQIPTNFFKRLIKKMYLNVVFKNKHIHGLAGGNNTHRDLFSYYGMKDERIHFLPMVIDVNRYKNLNTKKEDKFTFIYVGRIIEHKNIKQLLRVFSKTYSEQTQVQLKIVGGGNLLEDLKKQYFHCENIYFTGPLYGEELKSVYYTSHVLVLPSHYEPWGLVVNEALASGIPVVASQNVGSSYDLIKKGETGFTFDTNSDSSLEACLLKLSSMKKDNFTKIQVNSEELMNNYWNFNLYEKKILTALRLMIGEKNS